MSRQLISMFAVSPPAAPIQRYGDLYSWGNGGTSKLGTLAAQSRSSPSQVGAFSDWQQLSTCTSAALGIRSDGTLWAWGTNSNGSLGVGDITARSSPVQVGALTNWKATSGMWTSVMATKTDGTLWGWGYNANGQLCTGDTTNRSSPVQIGADTAWSQVSSGYDHCHGIKMDGTLWAWGQANSGQLGNNATSPASYSSPIQIGGLTNWFQVSSGFRNTAAIKCDGTLWVWGSNSNGELGKGNLTAYSSPVQVGALTNWVYALMTDGACYALKSDGTLWSWGLNNYGQLGHGNTTNRSSPVQVGALTSWRVISAASGSVAFAAGGALGLRSDGTLWSWGAGTVGQNGNGTLNNYSSPIQVGAETDWTNACRGGIAISSHNDNAAVFGTRNANGAPPALPVPALAGYGLYVMGDNFNGNLSYARLGSITRPIFISNALRWRSIACLKNLTSWGVRSDSKAYSVGSSANGYRGNGAPTGYLPVAIGSDTTWYEISCGLGVKAGGLYAWGANNYGQLGLSDTTTRSSPVQVGALSTWKTCSSNGVTGAAIKTDGTLWTWGLNSNGQLGSGTTTNRSSPVQVGALTTWRSVVVSADDTNVSIMAIKTDGTLWGWGYNTDGRLGDGSTTNRSSPVQVGAATNWNKVTQGFAINTASELYQLGTTLTQIAGAWADIASSGEHQMAIKTDGTAWSWGLNDYGQLGLGDYTDRVTPTQVTGILKAKRAIAAQGVSVILRPVGADA